MKLGFLVYDSRSGSTLLARLLSERTPGVAITQELGFEHVLRAAARYGGNPPAGVVRRCLARDYLRNLSLPAQRIEEHLRACGDPTDVAALLQRLVREHIQGSQGSDAPRCTLIKYGRHVLCWRAIGRVLGNATPLLHIVRDPRAVISSKLSTPRPYYPFETLAWGGSLLAAWRWRSYCQALERATAAGMNTQEVRYETLLGDPHNVLGRLQSWLCVNEGPPATACGYQIPAAEQAIHGRAHQEQLEATRAVAWRAELPFADQLRVEAMAGAAMHGRGYPPAHCWSPGRQLRVICAAAPTTIVLTLRHYVQHARQRSSLAGHGPAESSRPGDERRPQRQPAG